MCEALSISKKTYYKYRYKIDPDFFDYKLIKDIFDESKGTYGYRRIQEGLKIKYGVIFNHKKLKRIMKKFSLKAKYLKRIKNNKGMQRVQENVMPNIVKRRFRPTQVNKIWCTDVTYLIFKEKRMYLSTIIDLFDRKIVAYKISKYNNLRIVTDVLNEAIAKRKNVHGLIIHSDQGWQYTSFEYKAICNANGIQISMSRAGTPIDDSPIENWHSLLKKETLYNNDIISMEQYVQLVKEWIEFYNSIRIKIGKPKSPNFF